MDEVKNFNLTDAYTLISTKLVQWVESTISMLPNLLLAVLIVLVFAFIGRLVKKLVFSILGRITDNNSLKNLLASITFITVIAIGTFIALSILDLDGVVTSVLAGAGVVGLALGFAFQEIASNYIAGTAMSIKKPFELGDLIETNTYLGNVKMIHLRITYLETLEGQLVTIPNAQVFKNTIVNYTTLGKRRIDIPVGVTYGEDLELAKEVTVKAIKSIKGIIEDSISIFYTGFNDSSIDFTVRYWIPFTNKQYEYLSKRDEGIISIKKAFDEAGITIPFPIRTLDFWGQDLGINVKRDKTDA